MKMRKEKKRLSLNKMSIARLNDKETGNILGRAEEIPETGTVTCKSLEPPYCLDEAQVGSRKTCEPV